jgi:hypothetical protein
VRARAVTAVSVAHALGAQTQSSACAHLASVAVRGRRARITALSRATHSSAAIRGHFAGDALRRHAVPEAVRAITGCSASDAATRRAMRR